MPWVYLDYACALQLTGPIHGRLYITQHHICFFSNLFGFEKKVRDRSSETQTLHTLTSNAARYSVQRCQADQQEEHAEAVLQLAARRDGRNPLRVHELLGAIPVRNPAMLRPSAVVLLVVGCPVTNATTLARIFTANAPVPNASPRRFASLTLWPTDSNAQEAQTTATRQLMRTVALILCPLLLWISQRSPSPVARRLRVAAAA